MRTRERELEFWASKVKEIDTMNERDTVNERDTEIHCFWQKRRGAKMKSPKKTERRFGERQGVRRSIAVVQPAAITKQKRCNKESLLRRSYKRHYRSNIMAFSYTTTIVSAENDMFIAVEFWSIAIFM